MITVFRDDEAVVRESPAYTVGQVARYLRVLPSTILAWSLDGRTGRPLIARPGMPLRMSFHNICEAYVLRVINPGYVTPIRVVRDAVAHVSRALREPRPLLSRRFATDGIRVYLDAVDLLLEQIPPLNREVPADIAAGLDRVIHGEDGIARLYPFVRDASEDRAIEIRPARTPAVAGTMLIPEAVANRVSAGELARDVARDLQIPEPAVLAAVAWQRADDPFHVSCSCHP